MKHFVWYLFISFAIYMLQCSGPAPGNNGDARQKPQAAAVTDVDTPGSGKYNPVEEIPLLIITDFGRDVDDAQAFAFLARLQKEREYVSAGQNGILQDTDTFCDMNTYRKQAVVPRIAGVITTGYIPFIRAMSLELFLNLWKIKVPIAIGEACPLLSSPGKTVPSPDQMLLNAYLEAHALNGEPYEITLLKQLAAYPENRLLADKMHGLKNIVAAKDNYFSCVHSVSRSSQPNHLTSARLMDSLLTLYPNELRVVVLAQPTDLAGYIRDHREKTEKIHSIYVQGQANIHSSVLLPDFEAYNLREDTLASSILFSLQNKVPFTFLGKYAAYPMAFTRSETDAIAAHYGAVGEYLKSGALLGLRSFLEREPGLFYKIFGINQNVPVSRVLDSLQVLNNPYDLLTVIAITNPELFNINYIPDSSGKVSGNCKNNFPGTKERLPSREIVHAFIGNTPADNGIRDAQKIKSLFLDTFRKQ